MNRSILITGVAGSGKTAVCNELKKRGYKAYGIEDIDGMFAMYNKKTGKKAADYDNENFESVTGHDWLCDMNRLRRLVRGNPKGLVFYCGIGSNLDDWLPLFDKVFLLKASQKTLRERLSKRDPIDFGRTAEVQNWMFGWKKWWEDKMRKKGAITINANRNLREIVADIIGKSGK